MFCGISSVVARCEADVCSEPKSVIKHIPNDSFNIIRKSFSIGKCEVGFNSES